MLEKTTKVDWKAKINKKKEGEGEEEQKVR